MENRYATYSPNARREKILELLNAQGECTVEELAEQFVVSTMTIRRDLHELAGTGRVIRTHGGATTGSRVSFEFRYLERMQKYRREKEAIGAAAAALVQEGDSVMMDSGTTVLAVAHHLRNRRNISVITASLPIASALYGCEEVDLLLLGGLLNHNSPDLCGPITETNVKMIKADLAFIGADAVDLDGNLYQLSATVAALLGKAAEPAKRVYCVADHTKIGQSALMQFGDARKWEGIITDSGIEQAKVDRLRKAGVNVIVVDVPRPSLGIRM